MRKLKNPIPLDWLGGSEFEVLVLVRACWVNGTRSLRSLNRALARAGLGVRESSASFVGGVVPSLVEFPACSLVSRKNLALLFFRLPRSPPLRKSKPNSPKPKPFFCFIFSSVRLSESLAPLRGAGFRPSGRSPPPRLWFVQSSRLWVGLWDCVFSFGFLPRKSGAGGGLHSEP